MDTLQSLKSEILKPFQTVTILMGFKDMQTVFDDLHKYWFDVTELPA